MNNLLYGFNTKDFAVNGVNYSITYIPELFGDLEGPNVTGALHIILINDKGRSLNFKFGGEPAINISESILPPGVVVELIKTYREFWKGNEFGMRFYKVFSDELYQYLIEKGVTHFRVADSLNEEDQPIHSAIDQFLLEAYMNGEGEEMLPVNSDALLNTLQAERTQFYVSISPDTYIDFYGACEKFIFVS
jgi:hypothetical protein